MLADSCLPVVSPGHPAKCLENSCQYAIGFVFELIKKKAKKGSGIGSVLAREVTFSSKVAEYFIILELFFFLYIILGQKTFNCVQGIFGQIASEIKYLFYSVRPGGKRNLWTEVLLNLPDFLFCCLETT